MQCCPAFIALLKNDSRDIISLSAKQDFAPTIRKLLDGCQDGDQLGSLEILSNFELSQIGYQTSGETNGN